MIKITTVIVTFNETATIKNCLASIADLKVGWLENEIIIVDNSTDTAVHRLISKEFPQIKLIRNKENLGFGRAVNRALKKGDGKYIFLLNPDAQVLGDSFEKMVKFVEKNPGAGIIGPKLLNPNGSIQKEMTPFPSLLNQILILLRLHRLSWFNKLVYPNYDYNKTQEAEHLMGSALLIRKTVFDKVGLFDENFFLWFEETDLEKRAKKAGFKIVYYPKAEVKHLRSFSIKKINPLRRQRIWNASLGHYFRKHKSRLEQLLLEPFMVLSYLPAFLLVTKEKIKR